jgi:hypothetical protein
MKNKKSKKQSLVRQVAFILGTYEGGTVEKNLPLAKYIVAHVKRHLTKRAPDVAGCTSRDCGGDMEASLTCTVCGVTRPAGNA